MKDELLEGGTTIGSQRKQAAVFAFLVAVCASLLSFIVVAFAATYLTQGEDSLALGLDWALSQPATLLLAALTALVFPRYSTRSSLRDQMTFFLPLVLAVAVAGPAASIGLLILLTSLFGQ
jgi:hypothetical protein